MEVIKKKKKLNKKKKKFLVIASCYIAVFLITALVTSLTLSWYHSSTWSNNVLYMGGPVYIDFADNSGNITHGTNNLVVETPPNWTNLYPGMNIHFQASAILQGASWEKPKLNDETLTIITTGAILRAKMIVEVFDLEGNTHTELTDIIYDSIWSQLLRYYEEEDDSWIYDEIDTDVADNNFFYHIENNQSHATTGEYLLNEQGGVPYDVSVTFLRDAIITMPPIALTNDHADYTVKFTIVFHALQAFLPYENIDIGTPYQGNTSGRSPTVGIADLGTEKPLTIENSRRVFTEAFSALYN